MSNKNPLSPAEAEELLAVLKNRFEKNKHRHPGADWNKFQATLEADSSKLFTISEMERTGGEPDVVTLDAERVEFTVIDCSPGSPKGRRNLCFDRQAHQSRKENKPENAALDVAAEMGIELLTESQYRKLQELDSFDLKTSSWVQTPVEIRKLGGALFCDRRYDTVFLYHNGAESYYAARGFRGLVIV